MDSVLTNSQTHSNPHFGKYDLPPTVVVKIARLFDPKTLSACSQISNAWYRLIKGHTPIIRLDGLNLVIPGRYKGDHYSRYQILWQVNREEAAKINEAIGMEISFPSPTAQEVPLLIGKGGFGEFRIAKVVGEERYVGIKITKNSKEIEKEAQIQEALTGLPHLMPSLDYRTARVEGRLRLFQAMPLAGLGNLSRERNPEAPHKPTLGELIQGLKDHGFREQLIYHIAHSSLLGLQAMHGSQFYHLDFKGDNLVVDVNGEVWIIDFGCSGLSETGKEDTVKLIGDRRYYPFERMVCEKWKNHRPLFLATIDIWALGITLLELVHPGGNPFNMQQYGYLRDEGSYHSRLQGIEVLKDPTPDSLGSFISALLTVDPSNRPNATKALQHPWMVKMQKAADQWLPACKSRLSEVVREHKRRASMEGFSSSIGQLQVRQKRVEAPREDKPPPILMPHSQLISIEELQDSSLPSLGESSATPYPSRPDLEEPPSDAQSLPDEFSFSDENSGGPNIWQGRYRSVSSDNQSLPDELCLSDNNSDGPNIWRGRYRSEGSSEALPSFPHEVLPLPTPEILVPISAPKDLFSPLTLPLPLFTDFVPRLALQKTLEESLFSNKRLTVLQGMGGAGKSKMALYLLHSERVKEHFGLRLWFNAVDQENSLESQILLLARELNLIDARASMEEAFEAFYGYLERQTKPYLIVLDNANDPESLLARLPKENGHALITTRNASWSDVTPVGVLTAKESHLLIARLLQKEDPDSDKLAQTLGHLPLGLCQACAYIRNHNLAVSGYLDLLSQNASSLIQQNESLFGKNLPVAMGAVWETTFKVLEEKYPEALKLLDTIAYLAPDNIPQSLFDQLTDTNDAIDSLVQYSLASKAGENLSIHRLTQVTRQSKHDPQAQMAFLKSALTVFTNSFDSTSRTNKGRSLLWLSQGHAISNEFEKRYALCDNVTKELLLPFFQAMGGCCQILDVRASLICYCHKYLQVSKELGDPKCLAKGYLQLGIANGFLGNYQDMADSYHQLATIAKQLDHPDHELEATAYLGLGRAYEYLGQLNLAEKFLELHVDTVILVGGKAEIAMAHTEAAQGYARMGEHTSSLAHYKAALGIAEELGGTLDKNPTLKREIYLGVCQEYIHLKQYPEAFEIQEVLLNLATESGNRREIGRVYEKMGALSIDIGLYESAIKLFEIALQVAKALEDTSWEWTLLSKFAEAYRQLGNFEKQLEYEKKGLAIALECDDPEMQWSSFLSIGNAYVALKMHETALEYFQMAINISASNNNDVTSLSLTYGCIGDLFLCNQDFPKAIEAYQKSVEAASQRGMPGFVA